jgi:hypothetical protein
MAKFRPVWLLSLIPAAVVLYCFWLVWTRGETVHQEREKRREQLQEATTQADAALQAYTPAKTIDWRALPGVAKAEALVATKHPAQRLIHIRDWHYVRRELLGKGVMPRDMPRVFEEQLFQIELVQIDQMALLRALIRHHGLKSVCVEGLAPEGLSDFQKRIKQLRQTKKPTDPQAAAQHREDLLEMGAAGRLLIAEELKDIGPLEDRMSLEEPYVKTRQDALVRQALRAGELAVVILSGDHDLSASVSAASKSCDYIRLTTKHYPE